MPSSDITEVEVQSPVRFFPPRASRQGRFDRIGGPLCVPRCLPALRGARSGQVPASARRRGRGGGRDTGDLPSAVEERPPRRGERGHKDRNGVALPHKHAAGARCLAAAPAPRGLERGSGTGPVRVPPEKMPWPRGPRSSPSATWFRATSSRRWSSAASTGSRSPRPPRSSASPSARCGGGSTGSIWSRS